MRKIVIFASGSGSNAENIILHFNKKNLVNVFEVFTNNPNANDLKKKKNLNVPSQVFNRQELNEGIVLEKLNKIAFE